MDLLPEPAAPAAPAVALVVPTRGHAGELTNEPDGELWICADHALEPMRGDHEQGHLLHGDRGDRVGRIAKQGHLTQQVTLDERIQHPLLAIDPAPRLDRPLM